MEQAENEREGGREEGKKGAKAGKEKEKEKITLKFWEEGIKERKRRAHCVSAQKSVASSELCLQRRCILSQFRLKSLLNS